MVPMYQKMLTFQYDTDVNFSMYDTDVNFSIYDTDNLSRRARCGMLFVCLKSFCIAVGSW